MKIDAATIYFDSFNAGFRPDPELTVTEWADEYRYLPKRSSSEPGKYRSARVPYLREIMDCLSPTSPVQEICFVKATQIGATEAVNNWIFFSMDVAPGPFLCVFPSLELARDHSRQKLQTSIDLIPNLKGKIREPRSRESGNTLMAKEYPGGILFLAGSNSGAGLRSKSIRYLALDDVDGYDADVAGEGDPVELAKRRTDTFGNRKKILEISTPTTKGISRIEKSFLESDQRYYELPCPFCGHYQKLEWGGKGADFGLKFDRDKDGKVIDTYYECRACHERIDEHHKTDMLECGRWVPTYPEKAKRGYHLSSLYSPLGWVSWQQIVKEWLESKDHKALLKTFVNTRLGEVFEEDGERPEWSMLQGRAEPYKMLTVPAGGMILTAGIDVQDNRLAVVIRAWGRGEESWLIYWGEIYGDPGQPQVWEELDMLLGRPFPHAKERDLHVVSTAVDSGGHHTNDVYSFARRKAPHVIAIKGANQSGKPIIGHPSHVDLTWQGKTIENGAQVWPIGTDTAKSLIYSRLKIATPGPGCYHFPIGIGEDYFIQLTAEKLITRFVKGFPKMEWVKTGPRNEALDCEVYCLAAAYRAGIVHVDFDAIEKTANPETAPAPSMQPPPSQRWQCFRREERPERW